MVMKSINFWNIMPCSLLTVNRRFGGTYRLHLQGSRISQVRNQREAGNTQSSKGFSQQISDNLPPACLLVSCWTYFFDPEDGGDMFLRNVCWHSTDYTALYLKCWYSSNFDWLLDNFMVTLKKYISISVLEDQPFGNLNCSTWCLLLSCWLEIKWFYSQY
jgi:hypothetical protein